jgi:hypothetical protein
VGVAWNSYSISIFEMPEAGFGQRKLFNVGARCRYGVHKHRTPSGWLAHWHWVLVIPLVVLTSCAPPMQNAAVPSVNPTSTGMPTSSAPMPTNMPTATVKPSATFVPLPATATTTSAVATAAQNLITDAIKFTGDVQFPEVLEKMRQDILYLKGVTDVQVGYGEVDVTYNPDQITLKQIETVIEDHGYHVQE